MAPEDQPIGAYYTVRRWRPDDREIDALFVLHGVDEPRSTTTTGGRAARWAAGAAPGDPVALWGPRTGFAPPPDTDRYLLVADDTGLPAVAAIIESLPPGTPIRVVAEVDAEEDRQPLPERDGVEVTWGYRRGAAPGTTTFLQDAVRTMAWPDGTAVRLGWRREQGRDRHPQAPPPRAPAAPGRRLDDRLLAPRRRPALKGSPDVRSTDSAPDARPSGCSAAECQVAPPGGPAGTRSTADTRVAQRGPSAAASRLGRPWPTRPASSGPTASSAARSTPVS